MQCSGPPKRNASSRYLLGSIIQVGRFVHRDDCIANTNTQGRSAAGVRGVDHGTSTGGQHTIALLHEVVRFLHGGLIDANHEVRRGTQFDDGIAPTIRTGGQRSGSTGPSVSAAVATYIKSTISLLVFFARGWGAMITELRPFTEEIALMTGVASGLVDGDSAPMTPTGLAI